MTYRDVIRPPIHYILDKKKDEKEKEVKRLMKQMENKYKPCHILPMIYKHGTKEVPNAIPLPATLVKEIRRSCTCLFLANDSQKYQWDYGMYEIYRYMKQIIKY